MHERKMLFDKKAEIKYQNMSALSEYRAYLCKHPRLTYLFLELTDRCNLSCIHCGSKCDFAHSTYLDTALICKTLDEVAEDFSPQSVMICVTGGEPLLHPDFEEITAHIRKLGFPWGMTSNGSLISEAVAIILKNNGMGTITLSLDGLEESHDAFRRSKGNFKRTLGAVCILQKYGFKVQITTVVHQKNIHELEEMYCLMADMGIASWRVINMEPIGRANNYSDLLLSYEQLKQLLDFIRDKRFFGKYPDLDVTYGCSHYLTLEYEHELRDNYFLCGSGIYVASILCNGDIYSCLDIERRSELIQGNISNDRFSDVWFHRFKEFRADRSRLCEECNNCKERKFCAGDSTHTWDFDNNKPKLCFMKML